MQLTSFSISGFRALADVVGPVPLEKPSILTGRNTWQLEEAMCHFGLFRAKWPVYPDLLERAGYHVGHTGKGWGPGDFKSGRFAFAPHAARGRRTQSKGTSARSGGQ